MSRSDLKGDPSLTFKLTRDSFPSAPFLVLGILSISAFRRCSSSLGENDRGEKNASGGCGPGSRSAPRSGASTRRRAPRRRRLSFAPTSRRPSLFCAFYELSGHCFKGQGFNMPSSSLKRFSFSPELTGFSLHLLLSCGAGDS